MKKIFYALAMALLSSLAMADETAPAYIFNISYEDAQDAVGKALTEKLNSEMAGSQRIAAVINGKKTTPLYSSNKPIDVEVRGLRVDSNLSRWSASLIIMGDDTVVSALPLAGRYMAMNDVPVLKHSLRNGEVISESDVEVKSFPQERSSNDVVTDAAELIGRTPIRTVSPNRPIRNSEISAPALIKKNALVQMRYKTPSMEITTSGQALGDGAKGDVIEVRNTTSKKITHAVVSTSNTVDVLAQDTETSQIMPANGVDYAK